MTPVTTLNVTGQILHSQAREIIYNVFEFMKNEAQNGINIPIRNFKKRVLAATKISDTTYRQITRETPSNVKKRTKSDLNRDEIESVKRIIHDLYLVENKQPTLKDIHKKIIDSGIKFKGGYTYTTLRQIMEYLESRKPYYTEPSDESESLVIIEEHDVGQPLDTESLSVSDFLNLPHFKRNILDHYSVQNSDSEELEHVSGTSVQIKQEFNSEEPHISSKTCESVIDQSTEIVKVVVDGNMGENNLINQEISDNYSVKYSNCGDSEICHVNEDTVQIKQEVDTIKPHISNVTCTFETERNNESETIQVDDNIDTNKWIEFAQLECLEQSEVNQEVECIDITLSDDQDEGDLMDIDEHLLCRSESTFASATDVYFNSTKERVEVENSFKYFMRKRDVPIVNETAMLTYFRQQAQKYRDTSLWTRYSIIRRIVWVKHRIDISSYRKLKSYLTDKCIGHFDKKTKTFTRENMVKFLVEAPDDTYLMAKTALIFAIYGACRTDELASILITDIEDRGSVIVVNIRDTSYEKRIFTIVDDSEFSALTVYRKYAALRPLNILHSVFFLQYSNKMCSVRRVGKQIMGGIPTMIAAYLSLENPLRFTKHAFLKTSLSLVWK